MSCQITDDNLQGLFTPVRKAVVSGFPGDGRFGMIGILPFWGKMWIKSVFVHTYTCYNNNASALG